MSERPKSASDEELKIYCEELSAVAAFITKDKYHSNQQWTTKEREREGEMNQNLVWFKSFHSRQGNKTRQAVNIRANRKIKHY